MTNNTLRIRDIWRAALLLAQGVPMQDCPADEHGLTFIFDNTDGQAQLAAAALLDDRPIGIRTYLECHRRVRELIYQNRMNRKGTDIRGRLSKLNQETL